MKKNKIYLKNAINLILETLYGDKKENIYDSPYFFLVGAGISKPEIKDTQEITEECISIAKKKHENDLEQLKKLESEAEKYKNSPVELCSFWVKAAFKTKVGRQQYLKEMVQSAKISSANLLLAQILCSKQISTSVISSNFDDKLFQALKLLGEYNIFTADNVLDGSNIKPSSDQIQIIYAHNSYHFYDFGISGDSQIDLQDINSKTKILDNFFKNKLPIVIGYSGWENDIIMDRLKEELKHPLMHCVLWFCYSEEAFNDLPEWLVNNGNVLFVLPENNNQCNGEKDCILTNNTNNSEVLTAYDIFSAIIAKFEIQPPEIFSDTFKYYARIITELLPVGEDIFYLKRWSKQLKIEDYDTLSDAERMIKKLENAAARKNLKKITEFVNVLNNLEFLSRNDFYYVLFSIIYPVLNQNNSMSSNEDIVELYNSVVIFLEKKIHLLTSVKEVNKVLNQILLNLSKNSSVNSSNVLQLSEKIIEICRKSSDMLSLEIMAMGIALELLDEESRFVMKDKITGRCIFNRDNIDAAFLGMDALYKMFSKARTAAEKENIFESVQQMYDVFYKDKNIQKMFYSIKLKLIDESTSAPERFNDYIEEMSVRGDDLFNSLILQAYQRKIKATVNKGDQLRLCKIAIKYGEKMIQENCGSVLSFIDVLSTKVLICADKPEASDIKKDCIKILDLQRKIPFCIKAKMQSIFAMNLLASIAIDKTEKEKWYRSIISICMSCTDKPEFLHRLISAIENLIKILPEDRQQDLINENKPYQKYSWALSIYAKAMNDYMTGNYQSGRMQFLNAYALFKELFGTIFENQAGIHLAYIKRKYDSADIRIPLLTLLEENSSNYGNSFRCINLALCYIEGKEVQQSWVEAISVFNKIKNDVIFSLNWWKNVTIVGEEESALVILLLYLTQKIEFVEIGLSKFEFMERCKKITHIPQNFEKLFPNIQPDRIDFIRHLLSSQ